MDKSALRREIREKKRAMPPEEIERRSARLGELFAQTEVYRNAKTIYGYMPYNQEVRTVPILMRAIYDGKRVAVPKVYGDTPVARYGEYQEGNCTYKEDILVGYRGFDYDDITPMFPFGHGLSYGDFEYSDLAVDVQREQIVVSFKVKNTGSVTAMETAQLYIGDPVCSVMRPVKELRNFKKVKLQPDETALVSLPVSVMDLCYYDEISDGWKLEDGEFTVLIGASSRDIRLEGSFHYTLTEV